MTNSKTILLLALLSFSLFACTGSEPAAVDEQESDPADETTPAKITPQDPTATTEPPAAPTVEPTPRPEEPEPSPTAEISPPSSPEPTEPVFQPAVDDISIAGAEDLSIQTTLYTPAGSAPFPGVILLHMLGSSRQVWADNGLVNDLNEDGYAVLNVDMRGHGQTGSSPDWPLAVEDLRLVWEHFAALNAVDPQRTAVIGASIGSNLALQTGADQPAIQTVILLSPGLDYRGVVTEDPMARFGSRPILIVASEEDVYSAGSSRTLADLAQGESQLEIYNGAGHGTNMFNAEPELATLILTWLDQNLN